MRYPVKAINVLKAHGKSAQESQLLKGYAINLARAAQGMPRRWAGGLSGKKVRESDRCLFVSRGAQCF